MSFKRQNFKEADLYKPVKDFFTGLGYAVNAEVKGIDVAMVKDGILTVIELKKAFNMTLLYQAVDRQSITSQVYVAIPRPRYTRGRECALMRRILKKLGIGLIFVSLGRNQDKTPGVIIDTLPTPEVKNASKKRKESVLTELAGRSADVNTGGQTGKPIGTAYREQSIKIACLLEKYGALSPKELVDMGCAKGARTMLYRNHHGWFEHVSKGLYGLSAQGIGMLMDEATGGDFAEIVKSYREGGND
ncbi:MAG: DUF2161 family putative PD-(D/E)XK-type phosphodiesterase [Clostridiales bacterium]|nr:DUF2161 family putative PD-(D/E)XK-type phosphodiesterase [Clostridiales bacterium]